MIIDARTLPAGATIEADICIVGAGAAGITLACDLASHNLRVALLESGGLAFEEETQDLYQGPLTGHAMTPLALDRLRYLGGTTNHWSGGCRPFDPADFAAWPFGRDVLDPYYRRAQELCQLGRFSYDPAEWQNDHAAPLALRPDARLKTGMYQYSPPTRFGEVYRPVLEKQPGLTVYLHANLTDIATGDNAARVTGLALRSLDGKSWSARAGWYVLAAGGLENARLLLNSDTVQKAGLGNGYDKVGRYFMDHPCISLVASLLWLGPRDALSFYADSNTVGDLHVQGFMCAPASVLRAEGMPAFAIGIQAGDRPDRGFWRKSISDIYHAVAAGRVPDDLGYQVGQIARGVEWEADKVYRRLFNVEPSIYSTNYICDCPPDPESRVTLIEERDALGLRRIALDWRLPADFEHNMRRAHAMLADELGRAGLGRLRLHSAETGYDPMSAVENGHHHMGTTRMDRDPRLGVVDENSRLHGCANLFVAGSSVFPSYSFDNPTMTIVALALKLSDHLQGLTGANDVKSGAVQDRVRTGGAI
jgi:choline dehydrogenase-like flavoprotein